jgi:hypothetical protein
MIASFEGANLQLNSCITTAQCGGDGEKDTPVPMPNTEVKLLYAESSWWVTACEGRKSPRCYGGLAQLGERLPYKQRVTGSSPVSSMDRRSNPD